VAGDHADPGRGLRRRQWPLQRRQHTHTAARRRASSALRPARLPWLGPWPQPWFPAAPRRWNARRQIGAPPGLCAPPHTPRRRAGGRSGPASGGAHPAGDGQVWRVRRGKGLAGVPLPPGPAVGHTCGARVSRSRSAAQYRGLASVDSRLYCPPQSPAPPCRPKARQSSMAMGASVRSRVLPSRLPRRSGKPPAPLTPRLRNTCLRAFLPSLL
jgi:hypothetical protein